MKELWSLGRHTSPEEAHGTIKKSRETIQESRDITMQSRDTILNSQETIEKSCETIKNFYETIDKFWCVIKPSCKTIESLPLASDSLVTPNNLTKHISFVTPKAQKRAEKKIVSFFKLGRSCFGSNPLKKLDLIENIIVSKYHKKL